MPKRAGHAHMVPASYGNRVRDRINTGKIVNRLQRTALGEEEMTQNELTAARMLLDRTVPVLKAKEPVQGEGGTAKEITNAQLFNLIEGKAERVG